MTTTPASGLSSTIVVHAPPAAVFAIVADARQHGRIDGSGTVRDAVDAPDRLALGSTFGMQMKMGGSYRTKNRVVEFDEGKVIAWRHVGAHRWRYSLVPVDGGTQVTETWDLSPYPTPYGKGVGLLFGRRTQRAMDATLLKLKAAAESDAAGAVS